MQNITFAVSSKLSRKDAVLNRVTIHIIMRGDREKIYKNYDVDIKIIANSQPTHENTT
jgi:hypothetical protein